MENKIKTEYKDLQEIGKGTLSTVYKGVLRSNNKTCALKRLKAEFTELYEIFLNEIAIQRDLSHPNIMPIYSFDSNKETREAYYTMPYLRSLRNLINNRTQRPEIRDVVRLIRDAVSALDHAKKCQTIAHNHLKPENIFFSEETQTYLLADWSGHLTFRKNNSLAKKDQKSGPSKKRVPSSIYEAPEAMMSLDALSRDKISSFKADIYSLGIVILEFCGIEQERLGELNCALIDEDFNFMQSKIQEELSVWYPYEKIVNALLKMTSRWSHDRPSAYELIWQTENLNYSILESEKSEPTLGDESDRKPSKEESILNRSTTRSKPSIFFQKKHSGTDIGEKLDVVHAKPSFHRKNTEGYSNQRDALNDSRGKKSRIWDDESITYETHLKEMTERLSKTEECVSSKGEGNYTLSSPEKQLSKSNETTMMTQEVQSKRKAPETPDDQDESKESDDGIVIVKNSLVGPRSRANTKFVLMSKEELIKSQKKQQQKKQQKQGEKQETKQEQQPKSGFSNFLDNVGEGLSDFGKKAMGRFENLNFFGFMKEMKKTNSDPPTASPKFEKTLSEQDQMLMTSQLKLPKFSYSEDPRQSLFSPGDHGEIDFEPEELLDVEPKRRSNPKQRYTEAKPIEKLIQKVYVFSGPIVSTSWSPNGKHIVTGSLDHSVRIMDTETNECVEDVGYVHRDPVLCVAWSPEGSNIASGSDDGSLKVFNFQMNKLHHSFDELYVGSVSSVAWSPDGIQIASASHTAIKIVDYYNKKLVHTFKELHTDDINEIAWAKNGRYLASVSADKTVKIIDVDSKTVYHTFEVFEGEAKAVAWSRASTSVAVGSTDLSLKVLDIVKKEVICSFDEALGAITSVAWSNDGKYLASGSEDCLIRIYEYSKKLLTIIIEQHKSHILTLNWAPDSENLISASKDCKLFLYNVRKKTTSYTWNGGFDDAVTALSWSKNKQYVAAGSAKGTLRVYNMQDMSTTATVDKGHQGAIKCVSWSHDGKFIATGSQDCSLMVYSLHEQQTVWTVAQLFQSDVNAVDWSSNGRLLLTGSNEGAIKVIDVQTKAVLFHFSELHGDAIRSVAWARDSKRFVSCANDWSVHITRIDTLKTECLYSEIYWPSFIGWSDDETSIVSGTEGGTIKVFELQDFNFKREMTTRPDSVDVIYGYSHAAEVGVIAAISIDPSIKIYNYNTKELLFELEGHDQERVCTVALSQDGKRMITGLQDGSMRVYNLTY